MLMTILKRTIAFAWIALAIGAGIATGSLSVGAAVLAVGVAEAIYVGYRYKF